eukprot:CAMPEP_0119371716 /NCGR_PEP_ID=MMETSP1334-20130426/17827_1 /TAXON_ID=127549 /ORGANISM="Calcidiscus leptoporus, Strain RCC1130" /LENGTH=91 /DNA_ID=CAMNT_0007389047 /DNA_START=327 /DNA_END=597 /DNA_ORIENTATION=+
MSERSAFARKQESTVASSVQGLGTGPGAQDLWQPHGVHVGATAHLAAGLADLALAHGAKATHLLGQPALLAQQRLRGKPAAEAGRADVVRA